MSRRPPNPTRKDGFQNGKSGNPGGPPREAISDLGAEARRYGLTSETLVEIMLKGEERNGLVEKLDRRYGRPMPASDMAVLRKRLTELSRDLWPAGTAISPARQSDAPAHDHDPWNRDHHHLERVITIVWNAGGQARVFESYLRLRC
jgi:hypothetical protein